MAHFHFDPSLFKRYASRFLQGGEIAGFHYEITGAVFENIGGSYLELLKRYGMIRSMSGKGNCYDNAVVESFFRSLKNEIIHHRDFQTRDQARTEIFEYIELFYNRKRIHQSLNYETPINCDLMSVSA